MDTRDHDLDMKSSCIAMGVDANALASCLMKDLIIWSEHLIRSDLA